MAKTCAFAFFNRKFVSQQPKVVENCAIANFDGFLKANTIKWENFKNRSKVKTQVQFSKNHVFGSYALIIQGVYLKFNM